MKKIVPYLVLFLCALLLWDLLFTFGDATFHIDGEEVGGPLGAALGILFAGGGTLIGLFVALVVALLVGIVLAVVSAGVGIVVIGALAIAGLAVAAAIVPFLLPLLLPLAVIWYLVSRSRRNRSVEKVVA